MEAACIDKPMLPVTSNAHNILSVFCVDFSFCCIIMQLVDLWNRTLVVEDKLSSSQQLDFIRSEGELKCCALYGS